VKRKHARRISADRQVSRRLVGLAGLARHAAIRSRVFPGHGLKIVVAQEPDQDAVAAVISGDSRYDADHAAIARRPCGAAGSGVADSGAGGASAGWGSAAWDRASWGSAAWDRASWGSATWDRASWGSAGWGWASWSSAGWGWASWGSAAWGWARGGRA